MTWRLLTCSSLLCAIASGAAVTGTVRLTGTERRDRSGVVVWLEPAGVVEGASGTARSKARMEQRGKRFVPHVVAIQAGSEVEFPNYDPIFHNAFSNFSGQVFDLGLYAPGDNRARAVHPAGGGSRVLQHTPGDERRHRRAPAPLVCGIEQSGRVRDPQCCSGRI